MLRGVVRAVFVAIVIVLWLRAFVAVSDFVIGSNLRGNVTFADWSAFGALIVGVLAALVTGAPGDADGKGGEA